MRTIKIRFTETKGTYHIQRKTWFGWKDIGYRMSQGGFIIWQWVTFQENPHLQDL